MPIQESPLRKLPLLPGVEAETRDSMNPKDIVRFWAPGAHVKDDVRSKIERTEEGILWKEAMAQSTTTVKPMKLLGVSLKTPEHDHRSVDGQFHKLSDDVRHGFLVWMEQVGQEVFESAVQDRWGEHANFVQLGPTVRYMEGIHPQLGKASEKRINNPPSIIDIDHIRELAKENGWDILEEHFPENWNKLVIGIGHLHGNPGMFTLKTFQDSENVKKFFEHQGAIDAFGTQILKKFGPDVVWLFLETFPKSKEEWNRDERTTMQSKGMLEALRTCPDYLYERIQHDALAVKAFLYEFFHKGTIQQKLTVVIGRYLSMIGNMRLGSRFSYLSFPEHIFGDGRLDCEESNPDYTFVVPHTQIIKTIHEKIPPQSVILLPFGSGHFKSADRASKALVEERKQGKYMEDFLEHVPGVAWLTLYSQKDADLVKKMEEERLAQKKTGIVL